MQTVILSILALSVSTLAQAAPKKPCPGMLNELHGVVSKKAKISKDTYSLAKNSLAHYREAELGGYDNRPHVDLFSVYYGEHQEVTGYKVGLTDGGDESYTTYYLDRAGKMVYARYDNQSPQAFWFCGQKTPLVLDR